METFRQYATNKIYSVCLSPKNSASSAALTSRCVRDRSSGDRALLDYRYYTGAKVAPLLTLVIGGNHEASNYMWELCVVSLSLLVFLGLLPGRFHGGWLAPKIFFVGNAGCFQVNGIRIAGMSGIFNRHHYRQGKGSSSPLGHTVEPTPGFYEKMPYSRDTMRSIYHIREYNFRRLALVRPVSLFEPHQLLSACGIALEAAHIPLTRLAGVYRTPWQSRGPATTETLLQGRRQKWRTRIPPSIRTSEDVETGLVVQCSSSCQIRSEVSPPSSQSPTESSRGEPRRDRNWRR